jgi:F-type H+-transporting ATPase subunit b
MDAAVNPAATFRRTACEFRRKLPMPMLAALLAALVVTGAAAQAPDAHAPAADAHQAAEGEHAAPEEHGGEHGGLSSLIWPTINFLILCGGLYYFLRAPFGEYLAGRSGQIRRDLVDAAELNRAATAQLAEVDRKVQALPGEIDALRARGTQEIAAEEARIAAAAAAERERLLTQTRREIEVRLRAAQRELSEHAATLALDLAEQQLTAGMTPADHNRLVDRYLQQVKEPSAVEPR